MIRRRTKDVLVRFTIPLPRRFWRRREHTEAAKANMSVGQRRRWDYKAALEQAWKEGRL